MSKAAVFSDVEGTLVNGSLPGMFLQAGKELKVYSLWQSLIINTLGTLSRPLPGKVRRTTQLINLLVSVKGQTPAEVEKLIQVVTPRLKQNFKPKMIARLKEHEQNGLPLVLVSGAMHQAVVHLGKEMGGRGEGTHIKLENGVYKASVDGEICQKEGKAARARAIVAEMGFDPTQCYAYGDTASDIPFLSLFGYPHAVDPDPKLAEEAKRRGWPIITTV
jgi:HAD superfamily hydrolase (TIGR01490 family)